MEKHIIVECNENHIAINRTEITFPVHLNTLIKLFGEPSQQTYGLLWNVVWDDLGIYCDYGSWHNILDVNFLQSEMTKIKFTPKRLFSGTLLVDNKDMTVTDFDVIELKKNAIHKMRYQGRGASFGFSIGENSNYKEETQKDKYIIVQPNEEVIQFKDFNFKLSIIQELMYNQEVLLPKFDLYEFVEWYEGRKIDIENEGHNFIAEVTQYFKELPITTKQAESITEIHQDGGNETYMNMLRFGSGAVDVFDIESVEDAVHFSNLKKVRLCYAKEFVLDEFNKMGIDAEWL